MNTNILIGVGVGCALMYIGYKFLKRKENGEVEHNVNPDIETVETINYEMLYQWLRVEYGKNKHIIKAGAKFGIMPSHVARKTYKDETGNNIALNHNEDVLCVFIIDKDEENVVSHKYYKYSQMAESLKDLIPSDKVYIQPLKI